MLKLKKLKLHISLIIVYTLLIPGISLFSANTEVNEEGNKLLKEIDRNMTPESFESFRKIINIEPDGKKKEFVLYAVKKDNDKMVITFLSPKTEKGRSTLRLGDNMWIYIPNIGRPMRITSLQSVTGGIFNNSDIMQLDYSAEYNVIKNEADSGSRLLTLKAKSGNVAYDKLKMRVNMKYRIPEKIECYTSGNMLIKTLKFSKIKKFTNKIIRPSVIETESPFHKGYKAVMLFANIKPKKVKDEVFTLEYMPKIKDLRE